MSGLERLSALELLAGFRSHAFSPLEAFEALTARIERFNSTLGAFTTLCLERASGEAQAATNRYLHGGPLGPLDGVALAVKDLYDTEAVRTTYGSAMFSDNVPSRDAEAVRRARAAGAIVVGKTQTHEFAWGISSINSRMGTARNPWDIARISGGSSGGSAVALAAELAPLALGSDTGGSIRIPCAFCGTVGLKPTYGRVSTAGVFPLARSLDHAGPMARTVADAALLLAVIAGVDPGDPATALAPALSVGSRIEGSLKGLRVGLCSELVPRRLQPDVEHVFEKTCRLVAELGAELVEIELPEAIGAVDIYTVIQRGEALFTHVEAGLYPAREAQYGDDVRRSLELAREVELPDYLAADVARGRLRAGFRRVFDSVDLLLTPVAACSPFTIGEETIDSFGEPASLRELVMGFTVPQDLAGLPACAVRAGFDDLGCPVAVQLTGAPWDEQRVLSGAYALTEVSAAIQSRRPSLGDEVKL